MLFRRERDEVGASAVEFALVFPLLAALLLGIVTLGLSYSQALGVTNAVREGTRFGATTDASATTGATWSADVIARVRDSQFDDPNSQSRVCVQLWKIGTGVVRATQCSGSGTINISSDPNAKPKVPSGPVGSCVVRVLASRPFKISIGVAEWGRTLVRSSIARYERKDKVTACS